MNLTKGQYKFNPVTVAKELSNENLDPRETLLAARRLARRGFNSWEAEAILREGIESDRSLERRTAGVYSLVMKYFGKEYKLELNEDGVPCRRGTMPGNYDPNKTILVPVGTPIGCDPTSETYWSM